ncbi:MAG TPA: response regulator [Thermomicrobiales bacterium]|nr:response regulator [Thermomicrobiales bacterium]
MTHEIDVASSTDQRRHIIVINDSAEILALFTDLLNDEGYRVTTGIFSGEIGQLKQQIMDLKPDLLILDMIIGREDNGWQLVQLMKMDPRSNGIPMIICTGMARRVEELGTHLSSMNIGVILKPFDIQRLLDMINIVWDDGVFPAVPATSS